MREMFLSREEIAMHYQYYSWAGHPGILNTLLNVLISFPCNLTILEVGGYCKTFSPDTAAPINRRHIQEF